MNCNLASFYKLKKVKYWFIVTIGGPELKDWIFELNICSCGEFSSYLTLFPIHACYDGGCFIIR